MSDVSAQVSVYPLRRSELSPAVDAVVGVLREHGLDVRPGPMSTLAAGDEEAVFAAIRESLRRTGADGEVVLSITLSNAVRAEDGATTS